MNKMKSINVDFVVLVKTQLLQFSVAISYCQCTNKTIPNNALKIRILWLASVKVNANILQEENQELEAAPVTEQTVTDKTENSISENPDAIAEAPVEQDMEAGASVSAVKKGNREKFDSGIGDEIIEAHNPTSPDVSEDEDENHMDVDLSSSSSSDEDVRPNKRQGELLDIVCGMKWRFVADSSSDNENSEEEAPVMQNAIRTISSPYSIPMRNKIQALPLPSILKNYLNFYREF